MMVDLSSLPVFPRNEEGPVFEEPWQAQAFAMAVELHQRGHFSWKEWAEHLGSEIAAAKARGDSDLGDTYYHHWLAALEKLVAEKGIATPADLATRKQEWDTAARTTPHGKPIRLAKD